MKNTSNTLDFLIIGAGISGIGAACHLRRDCPDKSLAILEMRDAIGGTWDIFRYPGIRCDSDMYSFGYAFRPWPTDAIITDGASIRGYLRDTVDAHDIERSIHFGHRVVSASWSSQECCWEVTTVVTDPNAEEAIEEVTEKVYRARFLVMCPGYFSYDTAHTPDFEGLDDFEGDIIHPQFWPDDYDHKGKRVVVIGSGATAVTLVPALAKSGADVTMLQRSPTYYISLPSTDPTVRLARSVLPADFVSNVTRLRNTLLQLGIYKACQKYPRLSRSILLAAVKKRVGGSVDMRHFTPEYDPWDQRVCVVPDGDLFEVIRNGDAEIVTDHIERVEKGGVLLKSGRRLEADVIVTATGFDVRLFGGVEMDIDGEAIDPSSRVMYNAAMIDGVPNFAMIFGYSNVSWTRKVDGIGGYLCRLSHHMDRAGVVVALPTGGERYATDEPFLDLSSGYVKRAKEAFPKQGTSGPWRTRNNVLIDTLRFRFAPLQDGAMVFRTAQEQREIGSD